MLMYYLKSETTGLSQNLAIVLNPVLSAAVAPIHKIREIAVLCPVSSLDGVNTSGNISFFVVIPGSVTMAEVEDT